MLDALKKKMIENPEKYRQIAIRNLSKNKDGNLSKEGSPMWKGGITQEWQKWKSSHGKEFEKWRKVVYGRDGNKCKLCGSVKKLEAHHIIPIAENRSTAFLPMNGILLCHECHKKTSNFGGKIKRPTVTSSGKIRMICITIPHNFQIYETCGNYEWTDDGILVIFVSEMENKKYEFLVFLHEIIEATLCKDRGITTESITTFDMEYEKNRKQGDESEPGDNPLAPYQREHQFASTIEKKMSEQFSVSWKDYEETINSL